MKSIPQGQLTLATNENGKAGGEARAVPFREPTRAAGAVGCIYESIIRPRIAPCISRAVVSSEGAFERESFEVTKC